MPAADQPGVDSATGQATTRNKERARQFIETMFNQRDLGAARTFLSEDAQTHTLGAMTAYLTMTALSDLVVNLEHLVGEDDLVTILASYTGSQSQPLLGSAPSGKGLTGRVAFTLRFGTDGHITEYWTEIEPWSLIQQLQATSVS